MSLQRKENNLRRAQARFDKVSRRSKQFQIDFRREQNSRGRFHTRAHILRGEKTHHGGRGIIHKFANAKYRITGDAPSVTRTIKSWQPKTFKGKLFKANARAVNFAVHDVAQTAVDTALATETVGLKVSDTAQREVRSKLKQKYTREAVDDYHRGVFLMGRTATDAVKGVHSHLKTKKQYKLEKAKLQLKKADNKLYRAKTNRPKLCANSADLRKAKAEYRAKVKPAHGNKLRKAMNKRRLQAYKQTKRELKFEKKQLVTENKFRVKEYRNQKKIAKLSKPGLLILKPATYSAGRMKASAWQKAVNVDQDNDFVHAIDSAKRRIAEPVAQKVSKPQRLHKKEKQRDLLSDKKSKSDKKLNRQESKLKEKHDSYKKRKKKPKPKSKKKGVKDTISATLKAAWKFVKNVYEAEVKKFFLTMAIPVIVILLVFAILTMIFSATSSNSGFTLGTYAAQDYDLSEAEKYYTELAYNLNQKIRKVGSSTDWQSGLAAFGATWKIPLMNGYGDNPRFMTGLRSMILTATSCGHSSVLITTISMLITMIFTIGSSTAIQKICLKKSSMMNMSLCIGMTINPVGRNLTIMSISAAEAVRTAVITTANSPQAKATVHGHTSSSQLPTLQSLDSILTVMVTAT